MADEQKKPAEKAPEKAKGEKVPMIKVGTNPKFTRSDKARFTLPGGYRVGRNPVEVPDSEAVQHLLLTKQIIKV